MSLYEVKYVEISLNKLRQGLKKKTNQLIIKLACKYYVPILK